LLLFVDTLDMAVEVTTGVFDPRNYKENDPNWAQRRKSEYLSFPGKIRFTRTRSTERGWWEKNEEEEDNNSEQNQGLLVDEGGQMEEVEQEEVKKIRIVQIERKATRSGEQSNSADGFESKEARIQRSYTPTVIRAQSGETVDRWPRRKRTDITALYH